MKDATGGGYIAPAPAPAAASEPDAPAPIEPAPQAGAQPAAPVVGGGATSYEAAPEPAQCGQWVPAPVVVGGDQAPTTAPAPADGGDTPPEPIAGPQDPATGLDTDPQAAVATTPASELSTWPEWQQQFTALGLTTDEIAKLGSANLSNAQLAEVYERVHTDIVAAGGIPGQTKPSAGTGDWSPQWQQRFLELGLPQEFVTELQSYAQKNGIGAEQLERVYQQVGEKIKATQGTSGTQGVPGAPGSSQAPGTQAAQPAADAPGWDAQFEQAFRGLGMPDEVLQMYAQSGAPAAGLEAAFNHASGRVQDFTDRGWMQKFTEAGVAPLETWGLILGDQPAKDEDIQAVLDAHEKGQESLWQKGGQLATSLFPGGRLAQYVFGKEPVSGDKIDRSSPMEIGMAALSGVALFAAFRGAKSLSAGWAARGGGFGNLNSLNETLSKLTTASGAAAPLGEVESLSQAAMGATQTWGTKQKLLSLIPFTKLHREVVGLGHAEAAAKAFNAGGAAKMLANETDGAAKLATITGMFDDIKSGAVRVQGAGNAYFDLFRKGAPMKLSAARDGQELITVSKGLGVGNGNSQLVSLMEVGGQRLARTIPSLSKAQGEALGGVMAGSLAHDLGTFTKDGFRPMQHIQRLMKTTQPGTSGSGAAAAGTAAEAAAGSVDDAARTTAASMPGSAPDVAPAAGTVTPAADVAPATTADSIPLTVDEFGRLRTPAGLEVPAYAEPASGIAPAGADADSIARLADTFDSLKR